MVKVTVNGKQELLKININKECVDPDDVETLEELVLTAVNQAMKESQDMVSDAMSKVTGGLNIPGLF
jgi:DNA-binding YbaB/EbfC family protein